jgi:hypothetical protein
MNKVFDLCSWNGSAYMKAADRLQDITGLVSTPTGYFCEDGVLAPTLTNKAAEIYHQFKKIEYYWQNNFT